MNWQLVEKITFALALFCLFCVMFIPDHYDKTIGAGLFISSLILFCISFGVVYLKNG